MKITKSKLKQLIREELKTIKEQLEGDDLTEEDTMPVSRAAFGGEDVPFETALIDAVKKLVPNLSDRGRFHIIRNIGELESELKSTINRSYSVYGATKEFIINIANMASKL